MKKNKLIKLAALAVWGIITVAVYIAAVNSHNAAFLSAITNVFIALICVCAVLYAFLYVKVIGLRKKAGVSPDEKFEFEFTDKLSENDKLFLKRANVAIKLTMLAAIPPLVTVLCDVVITMLI